MASVKLYVYDLSNGMARQLSMQLTGRQIDGIWHTSVVVFGKEIFYGQGISITQPGRSHHGRPLQIIDMGETALDEETLNDYLDEMRTHYTADKYHLLDFNCNSFTDDCVGFLTGKSIPSYIKDLPSDFLSTPFGAALRPTIDSMFRGPENGHASPSVAGGTPDPQLAASILQSVASQAQAPPGPSTQATKSLTGPLHIITNPATFNHFLKTHRAVVALFTAPQTCPPCRVIEPVFDQLAEEKGIREGKNGAAFAKIDMNVGMGRTLASEWGIRATPTFIFFLDGKKIEELRGANATELRSEIDLLLFQAFPPHPHLSLSLPAIESVSLNPILFSQVPALDTVFAKQISFIDEEAQWPISGQTKDQVKGIIAEFVSSYLKLRYPKSGTTDPKTKANSTMLDTWSQATVAMATALPLECLFPIADMWRLSFLDPAVCSWAATLQPQSNSTSPLDILLQKAIVALDGSSKGARNFSLIFLRLLCNALSHTGLSHKLLRSEIRDNVTAALVGSLLHADATVRTASASLAFNIASVLQKERVDAVKSGRGIQADSEDDLVDWQIEVLTAVVEALHREKENEEVVHRLTAALSFLLRLSPYYESQIRPLLEVLQTGQTLRNKLSKGPGWDKDGGVTKKDVRNLLEEVADKLCP